MKKEKNFKVAMFAVLTSTALTAVAFAYGQNSSMLTKKAGAVVDVTTTHSLLLDESWGYSGEASKVKTSRDGNNFTINFSDNTKFGNASSGLAFTTTEDGLYISTETMLNGISQVYVKGSSTNSKTGITVYGHFYHQTNLVNDSETVNGELNSIISFEPTNYVAIQFEGIDSIESVESGYSCSEATDPFDHMVSGGQNTDGNGLFQSMTGLKTTLDVGTVVEVQMDVAVTGTFDIASCELYWVDQVWTVNGGESDKARTDIKSTIVTGVAGWHHVTFTATVRNFPNLRFNTKYVTQDTSEFGNAVYLIGITHGTLDSFNYKNVTITPEYYSMLPGGDNGNNSDKYYQSITGLSTELAVGTSVEVQMDVYVTGTFNSYSGVWAANTVYSAAGGELNDKVDITSLITSDAGWHTITFTATVRNFEALRRNSSYPVVDTSAYGNAVYLLSMNKSADSFNYKNVSIAEVKTLIYGGTNKTNSSLHQSATGLSTNLSVGTAVEVQMDVLVTGTFTSGHSIYVVDSVWSTSGGERNSVTNILTTIVTGDTGWHQVTFNANVRNFPNLRHNSNYNVIDTSEFGNAVYLLTDNGSQATFSYKNVVITAV